VPGSGTATGKYTIVSGLPIKLSSPATREFWEIPILFEDEHLLALDKPSGLLVSPDRADPERPNLMKLLHAGIAEGKPWASSRSLSYLMNAHRLDSDTSGVILLAKSKPVLVQLADLFGSEKPAKEYVALVQGTPAEPQFETDAKLGPDPLKPGIIRVEQKRGKRARTLFEVLERFSRWTLLKCRPVTGRTHQIRVHLRWLRLPIVADSLYGGSPLLLSRLKSNFHLKAGRTERPLLSRPALHAERLELAHPVTGAMLTIIAPWPKDLTVAVNYLRRYAGVESRMTNDE
jgi:RluA family pseudouridine synthase